MDELESNADILEAYLLQLRQLLQRMEPEERSGARARIEAELRDLEARPAPIKPPVAAEPSSTLAVSASSPRRPSSGSQTAPRRLSRIAQAMESVSPDAPRAAPLTGFEECTAAPAAAEVPSPTAAEVPSATAAEVPSATASEVPSPTAADVPSATSWRESSGRTGGADSYQLGDATRAVLRWATGRSARASVTGDPAAAAVLERRLSIAADPRPARPRTGFEEAAPAEEPRTTQQPEEPGPAEMPPPYSPGLSEDATAPAPPQLVHRGVSSARTVVTGTRGRPIAEAEAYAPLEWTLLWEEELAKEEATGEEESEGEGEGEEQRPVRLVPCGETRVVVQVVCD